MWIDIVVAAIFVLSAASGYRKGFIHTFIHTAGWLLSLVLAYAWYPRAAEFLREKTDFYNAIYGKMFERITEEGASIVDPLSGNLPVVLADILESVEKTVTTALAGGLSLLLFNVLSFLLVVVGIRIVFLILLSLLSKKNREGVTGFFDGVLGLLAGSLKGIILIFLLLALLVPVISITGSQALPDALADSRIAGTLYDNNLLFVIINDFI